MTPRRVLIRALDRRGRRKILGMLATWYARRQTGNDVSVFYDAGWIHRMGRDYILDQPHFTLRANHVTKWDSAYRSLVANVRDYWFFVYKPARGHVILDVGAGIGVDTAVFSRSVGENGRVFAIEAHPLTFRRLQRQCKWNALDNVIACQCAIMKNRANVYVSDRQDDELNTVSYIQDQEHQNKGIPSVSLDEFCADHGIARIDFLKMNIEGGERFAIAGMKEIVSKVRHLCIACHDFKATEGRHSRTKAAVIEFLRESGFHIVRREDDPRPFVRDHVHGFREACRRS